MAAGASGAELANIVNEAALRAVRDGRRFATQADIEESIVEGKIEFSADENSITITVDSLDYIAIDIHNETTVWITFWREEWEFSWLTSFSVTF